MEAIQREQQLAGGGSLQRGSNVGGGQIKTADWLIDRAWAAAETVPSSATEMKYCSCLSVNAICSPYRPIRPFRPVPDKSFVSARVATSARHRSR